MKPKTQVIVSACAVPAFAFIAMNRFATGHPWWAAMWAVGALLHFGMLVDSIIGIRQGAGND